MPCTTTRRLDVVILIVTLVLASPGCSTRSSPDGPHPGLVLGRETADSFLKALQNQDGAAAFVLLSDNYRTQLSEEERKTEKMQVAALIDGKPIVEWQRDDGWIDGSFNHVNIRQILIKTQDGKKYSYRMVVAKQDGAWKVDLFAPTK
jgi:hypothetical protein